MRFTIVSDANSESRLAEILFGTNRQIRDYFADRFYDDSGLSIGIVLMCRDPRWAFKRRIRYSTKENRLYMDIMLDLDVMARTTDSERKRIVGQKLLTEVPDIVAKYKFKDFDLPRFSTDFRRWVEDWMMI